MQAVEAAELTEAGLEGDHRKRPGKRAVTLIQAEHLPVISALANRPRISYRMLRRNLAVSGLNLSAMKGRRIRIGGAELRVTGPCDPCSRMEAAIGHGGYTAMRGHGGVTAEVLRPGRIQTGDRVTALPPDD
jgi:MOSC domain-containing protein YiiM